MKRILTIFLQFLLMLLVFFIGGLLPVFHLLPLWAITLGPNSLLVLDGLYLLIFLYMLFLAVAALRKRLPYAAINSTIAFGLALIVGFLAKFPFRSA